MINDWMRGSRHEKTCFWNNKLFLMSLVRKLFSTKSWSFGYISWILWHQHVSQERKSFQVFMTALKGDSYYLTESFLFHFLYTDDDLLYISCRSGADLIARNDVLILLLLVLHSFSWFLFLFPFLYYRLLTASLSIFCRDVWIIMRQEMMMSRQSEYNDCSFFFWSSKSSLLEKWGSRRMTCFLCFQDNLLRTGLKLDTSKANDMDLLYLLYSISFVIQVESCLVSLYPWATSSKRHQF